MVAHDLWLQYPVLYKNLCYKVLSFLITPGEATVNCPKEVLVIVVVNNLCVLQRGIYNSVLRGYCITTELIHDAAIATS